MRPKQASCQPLARRSDRPDAGAPRRWNVSGFGPILVVFLALCRLPGWETGAAPNPSAGPSAAYP